ncbi:hypothetical protein HMPREF1224_11433 [Pseudomonas sp. P179]|nr:hypothetical protein HMPREF1224_11433 [Pseudomonas sp. P179]
MLFLSRCQFRLKLGELPFQLTNLVIDFNNRICCSPFRVRVSYRHCKALLLKSAGAFRLLFRKLSFQFRQIGLLGCISSFQLLNLSHRSILSLE